MIILSTVLEAAILFPVLFLPFYILTNSVYSRFYTYTYYILYIILIYLLYFKCICIYTCVGEYLICPTR